MGERENTDKWGGKKNGKPTRKLFQPLQTTDLRKVNRDLKTG